MNYVNAYPKPSGKRRKNRGGNTRAKLQSDFEAKEIYGCEVCKLEHEQGKLKKPREDCYILDPAHRHERIEYVNREPMLWTFNQVIQAGRGHHRELDVDKEYREKVFQKLRGRDELYDND